MKSNNTVKSLILTHSCPPEAKVYGYSIEGMVNFNWETESRLFSVNWDSKEKPFKQCPMCGDNLPQKVPNLNNEGVVKW